MFIKLQRHKIMNFYKNYRIIIAVFLYFYIINIVNANSDNLSIHGSSNSFDIQRPNRREIPNFKKRKHFNSIRSPSFNDYLIDKEKRISSCKSIIISKFIFSGNKIYSDIKLNAIASLYINRPICFDDLMELREKLTLFYINNGYINSGVILPDQKIVDGIVTYYVIEGVLSDIEVSGNKYLKSYYIKNKLFLGAGPPLNVNQLQEKFQLLLQEPLIEQANAEIRPGSKIGQAILHIKIKEKKPYQLSISYNNHHSPPVGAECSEFNATHYSLSGWGDTLGIQVGKTKGLCSIISFYEVPVTAHGSKFQFYYSSNYSKIIEKPFDIIDIENKSKTASVLFSYPYFKSPESHLIFSLKAERKHSESYLFGNLFPLSNGSKSGKSDVMSICLMQDWVLRTQNNVFAVNSVFSAGIDAIGATINDEPNVPDGRFFSWLGQFQWASRISDKKDIQMIYSTDIQLSNKPLLSIEKFSIGGANSVRGYRENQIQSDNGLAASIEIRIPIFRIPVPKLSKNPSDGIVQLAPFMDYAWSNNNKHTSPEPDTISSIGVGLRWDPFPGAHSQIYWGNMLNKIDNSNNNLQDNGFHFLFNFNFFKSRR